MSAPFDAPRHAATGARTPWFLLWLLVLAIGGGATWAWLDRTGGGAFLRDRPGVAIGALAWVALWTSLNVVLRWLRWVFLMRRCDVRLRTRDTALLFLVTLPAVLTPLYLGELLRIAFVRRHHVHAGPVLFLVWLVERSSDCGALLLLWGLSAQGFTLCLLGGSLLLVPPFVLASRRRFHNQGSTVSRALASTAPSAIVSVLAWGLPCLSLWQTIALFGGSGDWWTSVEAFTRGTVLGGLSALPGGVGVAGSTTIHTLAQAQVPVALAAGAVAIVRAGTVWFAVSAGCTCFVLCRDRLRSVLRGVGIQQHFDELASSYTDEIPEHVRQRLIERKLDAMGQKLLSSAEPPARGLDVGCGHGWYAVELARRGWTMSAVDASGGQLAQAEAFSRRQGVAIDLMETAGSPLPYPDESFDFAYSINVAHHVTSRDAQQALLVEVVRVLKPGAPFFLHEMNTENPLFRLYMSYLFPLLKDIDEGTELWIRPTRLPSVPGAIWSRDVAYFTFLPDFVPRTMQCLLSPMERMLERSPLRHYSAHYMATLRKTPRDSHDDTAST